MATKPIDAVNRIAAANGNAYDPINNPGGLAQGGHRQNFVPDLQATASVAQWASDSAGEAATSATATAADRVQTGQDRTAAAQSAGAAAQSATDAAAQAARLIGTSSTSQTPSVALKTFTTQAGKAFDVGTALLIQSRSNIDRFMSGRVTAYSGTSLTVSVEGIGSVTSAAADWDIRVSGIRGLQGMQGIPGIATMPYLARNANTQIVAGNAATIFDLTGTFIQTFATCAALGANWYAILRNAGTGDITLDPNGSETIDGLTSFIMYPGEARLIQCDGTALRSIVLQGFRKTFTQSDNFITPPGYSLFRALVWSGGAGGARSGGASAAVGGAAGGCYPFDIPSAGLPNTVPLTVGAGGAASTNTTRQNGGDSQFGNLPPVLGGDGPNNRGGGIGYAASADESVWVIGFAGAPTLPTPLKTIWGGQNASSDASQDAVNTAGYGAGCGGGVNSSGVIRTAGTSIIGGNGGAAADTTDGQNGSAPGGGGGATRTGSRSGAGARGEIRIYGVV